MPARRVGHRQIPSDDFIRLDINNDATALFFLAPTTGRIRLAQGGDPLGAAIDGAQAIKVAAVIRRKLRNKLRSPQGGEAMIRVVYGKARKPRIDEQEFLVGKFLRNLRSESAAADSATVRHLVNLNIASYVCRTGKVARVMLARRIKLCRHSRDVAEFPDIHRGPNREPSAADGHAHRFVERTKVRVDDAGIGAEDD